MTHFPDKQQKFIQTVRQLFPKLKPTSAAIVATGLGISVLVPVYAAFSASTNQKTQLISQSSKNLEITLVSYAVTKVAYDKIIPQFVAKWKREKGQNIVIRESYGGSGSQARAVIDGLGTF